MENSYLLVKNNENTIDLGKMSEKEEKYYCPECKGNHFFDSKPGKDHLKYIESTESIQTNPKELVIEEEIVEEPDVPNFKGVDTTTIERNGQVGKIELSNIPGITKQYENKLKNAGIYNPRDLASIEPKKLVGELKSKGLGGIGIKTAEKLIKNARETCGDLSQTGLEIMKIYEKVMDLKNTITTGSEDLDRLVSGKGWLLDTTVEIYGPGGSGKSELAYQTAVNVFLPAEKGGLVRKDFVPQVLIIDTEGVITKSIIRLPTMCKELGLDYEFVLKNITIQRCKSSAQQESAAIQEHGKMITGEANYVLVIVDSLVQNFRVDYSEDLSKLPLRQKAINRHIKVLKDITALSRTPDDLPGILICCNQIQHKPAMFGDPMDNIGGNVVKHNLDIRIKLTKKGPTLRKAKQVDSSFMPEGEALFMIKTSGIAGEDGISSAKLF